ncbi:50S ribosomal protein L13 [bacterium]|nr:50S ribosomal protein L13 [bacterium]
MKTTETKKQDLNYNWYLLDASTKSVGRIATEAASILLGKHKVNYSPTLNTGDKVVIINSKKLVLTGKKVTDKMYYRHSGYAGGLKERNAEYYLNMNPNFIIQTAVSGMLPSNRLAKIRMANLYIYEGSEHPHQGQINAK